MSNPYANTDDGLTNLKAEAWEEGRDIGERDRRLLRHYIRMHDGVSDMIENGRLRERDIPDDYQWLVGMLTTALDLGAAAIPTEEPTT